MWSKYLSQSYIYFVTSIIILWITQSTSYMAAELCVDDSNEKDEIAFTCSCLSRNETIIIQGLRISSGSKHLKLPANTTHLQVGQCQAVHLSGSTLISLFNIHTLYLHDIEMIHTSYNFFLQYETQLRVLRLSSSGFAPLQDSLNIHAQKLTHILFDQITWDKELKLLLQTEENQLQEVLAITNSKIKTLGEINISSRYVKKLMLQNNMIGDVLTSALIQDSQDTLIENNSIDSLGFLSFDSNTQNFKFIGNTIKSLAMQSLVINNATKITILNNTFHHIERHGLAWLHLSPKQGYFIFSGNQLYTQKDGSLKLYFTVFSDKLEMKNNVLHTLTCNCTTMKLVNIMTTDSTMKEPQAVNEMFESSTFCSDMKNKTKKLKEVCEEYFKDWKPVISFVVIAGVIISAFSVITLRKTKKEISYEALSKEETNIK